MTSIYRCSPSKHFKSVEGRRSDDRADVLVDPYVGRACHGRGADGVWFVVGVSRCQRRTTIFLRFLVICALYQSAGVKSRRICLGFRWH